MRSQVYSWRLTRELQSDLERAARIRKVPVSSILDMAVQDWLRKTGAETAGDEEQRRLHEAAGSCLGVLAGRNSRRAEAARESIKARLRKRYAR